MCFVLRDDAIRGISTANNIRALKSDILDKRWRKRVDIAIVKDFIIQLYIIFTDEYMRNSQ